MLNEESNEGREKERKGSLLSQTNVCCYKLWVSLISYTTTDQKTEEVEKKEVCVTLKKKLIP